ncbi:MAG: hypothetical protein JSS09_08055, partial [Verrucomicrobia bacterium]|nr:hypothetical protein [Verrucomicrobiota bacterium]
MGKQQLEELIRLIERFRHGVSLTRLLTEDPRWNKKILQRGLKDLAVKNKITVLGNGKMIRYFASSQEKSKCFPVGTSYEKKSK